MDNYGPFTGEINKLILKFEIMSGKKQAGDLETPLKRSRVTLFSLSNFIVDT